MDQSNAKDFLLNLDQTQNFYEEPQITSYSSWNISNWSYLMWILVILLIILFFSLIGFNIFYFFENIIYFIYNNLISPILITLGYSTQNITNTIQEKSQETQNVLKGAVKGAIKGAQLASSENENSNLVNSLQYNPPPLTTNYEPDDISSSIQSTGKAGWCYIGTDKNFRSCAEVGVNDTCMSGQVFPTRDICINPNLRA